MLFVPALWVVVALGTISRGVTEAGTSRRDWLGVAWVVSMVGAFGLFIISLERVGDNVAIALFVAVGLFIGEEPQVFWLILFPIVFAACVALGLRLWPPALT